MNKLLQWERRAAFTLVELLFVIGVLAVMAAFLYPSFLSAKQKAQRISCTGRLKQIGLGFRIWAGDHTNLFPMQVSVQFGGTKEFTSSGETFRHLEIMSNELNTPRILTCPADPQRITANSFALRLSNSNLSYFVGVDADDLHPDRFLAGDRNILGGTHVGKNILELSSTNGVAWGRDLHRNQGNVGLADGSVQGFSSSTLRTALINAGLSTNRLAMP
jgi:prepilin-type N-terminal cleavage/methylation domain-containing protein/prepilin-type processing-associated H-X9-DG protein